MPNVVINGVTFRYAMMMPLIRPIMAPITHTISTTRMIGMVAISGNTLFALSMDCNNVAAITAAKPT
ncbi:hypothetical protein D3C87_1607740 [compost metagenome]